MKYGFIGVGNMAGAIVRGIVQSGYAAASDIFVLDKNPAAQNSCAELLGVQVCVSYAELIDRCEILFIGVKPVSCPEVYSDISGLLRDKHRIIVSMAAGISTSDIENMLIYPTRIIRIMPNINAAVGESTTIICSNATALPADVEEVTGCMSSVGIVFPIEEKDFSVVSAIAGCSPAFSFMYIDALARGVQRLGINKKTALAISAQAVLGSAKTLLSSGEHPYELIDRVCSPGGSTIEGICALSDYKFETAVVEAVSACVEKDKLLRSCCEISVSSF